MTIIQTNVDVETIVSKSTFTPEIYVEIVSNLLIFCGIYQRLVLRDESSARSYFERVIECKYSEIVNERLKFLACFELIELNKTVEPDEVPILMECLNYGISGAAVRLGYYCTDNFKNIPMAKMFFEFAATVYQNTVAMIELAKIYIQSMTDITENSEIYHKYLENIITAIKLENLDAIRIHANILIARNENANALELLDMAFNKYNC